MAKSKPLPFVPFDTGTFIAAQQRNIDALASASQIVVDGVKTIAQRQSEMMQSSVDQLVAAGQDALGMKAPICSRPISSPRPRRSTRPRSTTPRSWPRSP